MKSTEANFQSDIDILIIISCKIVYINDTGTENTL